MFRWEQLGLLLVPALIGACATRIEQGPLPAPVSLAAYQQPLAALADDFMEGRKPGTEGERKTVAYLQDQFRSLGLLPGNHGSYLQPVPMLSPHHQSQNKKASNLSTKGF